MDAALDDPEHRLPRRALALVPRHAAVEPPVGSLHRALGVVAVGVVRRAFVEGQRQVRAERRLHAHRFLGSEELLGPVQVGAKPHPVLVDPEHHSPARTAPAPPLHLVGDVAVGKREDLEATGVGDDRALPSHEPVETAEAAIRSGPGESSRWNVFPSTIS